MAGFLPQRSADASSSSLVAGSSAEHWVDVMLDRLAHRGPDGRAHATGPWGALGLNAFRTNVDRPHSVRPVETEAWTVVADVRLDDRATAAAALVRPRRSGSAEDDWDAAWSDLEILAAGLEREPAAMRSRTKDGALSSAGAASGAFPSGVLGDFVLAGLHHESGHLVCARDPMGVKPFYYADTPEGFAFASEPKALLALPFVSRDLDDETVADFIRGQVMDHERTFHAAIRRLPAFHRLDRSPDGSISVTRYGVLPSGEPPAADQAPARLADLLRQAVAARYRGARSPAVLLSGGLDSSSIAVLADALAREDGAEPVRTISTVFDATPDANERPQIQTVLDAGRFAPQWVLQDDHDPFATLPAMLAAQDEPFLAPGIGVMHPVYTAAAAAGVRVLLDGHGGDEVISHGMGRLGELAKAGRWLTFWHSVSGVAGLYGERRLTTSVRYGLVFGSGPAWGLMRRSVRAWRRWRPAPGAVETKREPVAEALLRRTGVVARSASVDEQDKRRLADESVAHRLTMEAPLTVYALEVIDRLAAHHGIEPRYPFLDTRVVSFCLGLPSSAKLGEGYTRLALRKAMQNLLPPTIAWRRDKLDFSVHLIEGLRRHRLADLDSLLNDDALLGPYFDTAALRQAHARFLRDGRNTPGPVLHLVWRAAILGFWLRDMRPPPPNAAVRPAHAAPAADASMALGEGRS